MAEEKFDYAILIQWARDSAASPVKAHQNTDKYFEKYKLIKDLSRSKNRKLDRRAACVDGQNMAHERLSLCAS